MRKKVSERHRNWLSRQKWRVREATATVIVHLIRIDLCRGRQLQYLQKASSSKSPCHHPCSMMRRDARDHVPPWAFVVVDPPAHRRRMSLWLEV